MRKRRNVTTSSSYWQPHPVGVCLGTAMTSLVMFGCQWSAHFVVESGTISRLVEGEGRNAVNPWLPDSYDEDHHRRREWTTSVESLRGGVSTDGGVLLDDDVPYWFVGTATPCIHPLDECTFIINDTYPFAGLWSDLDEQLPDKPKSRTTLSSSLSSSLPSSSSSSLSSSLPSSSSSSLSSSLPSSSSSSLHVLSSSSTVTKELSNSKLGGGDSPASRVQRIKEPELTHKNADEIHVISEHPEDPCVVSGRVDVAHNWFGYLGVFQLRRSETLSSFSASPARLYYRVTYPSGRVPVSLLFYLGDQVRSLNVRMNCLQRVQLVDQRGPQVIRLDPAVPQSGCVNRTRTAADVDVKSRDDRRSGVKGLDSSTSAMVIDCRGGRILRSNVERQWNVAVSSCGSPRGLALTYTVAVYGHIGKCPPSPGLSGADDVTWSSPELLLMCLFLSIITS